MSVLKTLQELADGRADEYHDPQPDPDYESPPDWKGDHERDEGRKS